MPLRFSAVIDKILPMESASNIVLIGMPGSGKSTTGILLAKYLRRYFVDTDVLLQMSAGRSLQEIVDGEGYIAFRKIEEETILGLACENCVIATGGSAVYSRPAMGHLKADGVVVFLDVHVSTLAARIGDFKTRGLAKRKDQSLADLFAERLHLYAAWADLTIECSALSQEQTCAAIMERLSR
jgi:shikimate kinase